jgi:hypothetical protein
MIEVKNPYKKEALLKAFEDTYSELTIYFNSLPVDSFFKKSPGRWSPSENLVHLIKSIKSVSREVRLPKMIIGLKFGKSERNSRMYPQIREVYLNKLVEGAKTPKTLEPDDHGQPPDLNAHKEQILKKWDDAHRKFISGFSHWKEKDLDRYILPHPILGNLTVREMIMFTVYHNVHHLTNVQKFLEDK